MSPRGLNIRLQLKINNFPPVAIAHLISLPLEIETCEVKEIKNLKYYHVNEKYITPAKMHPDSKILYSSL